MQNEQKVECRALTTKERARIKQIASEFGLELIGGSFETTGGFKTYNINLERVHTCTGLSRLGEKIKTELKADKVFYVGTRIA